MKETTVNPDGSDDSQLVTSAREGNENAWSKLLQRHRDRLLRLVRLRMDPRLRARIDPADVIQEAYWEASRRQRDFFSQEKMPFFVWLRLITLQKLAELYRHHLKVKSRNAAVEISIHAAGTQTTSAVLANQLMGQQSTPSQSIARVETERKVRDAIDRLDEFDREIILLRNFEQLSNVEAAAVLDTSKSTTSSRYVRALKKLKGILSSLSEFDDWQGKN